MGNPRVSLHGQARWLLLISGIFTLSIALSNTFVNVYLWKVDRSYTSIGWYNLLVYCTMPFAFWCAGWLATKWRVGWMLRIGIALHAIFYTVTLVGGIWIASKPGLLGFIMGIAGGFYWFSFNMLSLHNTSRGSRERFYGYNGVLGAVAGMVAPPVAGFFIGYEDKLGGLSGYHWIFGVSLGLFVLAALVSGKMVSEARREPLAMRQSFGALRTEPWRGVLIGCAVYGLREGVFLFLIGLLLYEATGSEFSLGKFVLLQSALSFVSFYLVGRFVRPAHRLRFLGAGAVAMAGAALFFLMPISPAVIVWYGSVIAVVLPLFLIPLQGFVFDGISAVNPEKDRYEEHVVIREIFGNAGRVVGIIAFLILTAQDPSTRQISLFAVGLGFVQLGTWLLLKGTHAKRFVDGKTRRESHEFPGTPIKAPRGKAPS